MNTTASMLSKPKHFANDWNRNTNIAMTRRHCYDALGRNLLQVRQVLLTYFDFHNFIARSAAEFPQEPNMQFCYAMLN